MHAELLQKNSEVHAPSGVLLDCLRDTLSGVDCEWPRDLLIREAEEFLRDTDDRGVQSLLGHQLKSMGKWETIPPEVRDRLEARALMDVVVAKARLDETRRIFSALERISVRALVLKGAALAHVIYAHPGLRPACDIDLLVREVDRLNVEKLLKRFGYSCETTYAREVLYTRRDGAHLTQVVDLHWAVSESEVVAREFSFDELWRRSISVKAGAMNAPGVGDSLMIACTHLAQHREWDRLIWLYDVYLLAQQLDDREASDFIDRAGEKRLREVCRHALRLAIDYYQKPVSSKTLMTFLTTAPSRMLTEASAHLLARDHLLFHDVMLKLRVGDLKSRVRWVARILRNPAKVRRLEGTGIMDWWHARQHAKAKGITRR